jgi:hypothetical protein
MSETKANDAARAEALADLHEASDLLAEEADTVKGGINLQAEPPRFKPVPPCDPLRDFRGARRF